MKSYTDLEQSKKLAEILPLESADLFYNKSEQSHNDKVEPKFKVGDWIVGANNIYKIISLNDDLNCYIAVTINNEEIKIPYYFDDEQGHMCSYHLWSINDAKDGDVLTVNGRPFIYCCNDDYKGNYCCIDSDGVYRTGLNFGFSGKTILPATKEQRDTLMKAIADTGYEWDEEKKELMKIEKPTK